MLVTSDTMTPLLDGLGNPARNGSLLVVKGTEPSSAKASLYLDRELSRSAPNPVQLNSAALPANAVYAGEDAAWCFVYDKHENLVRSYPLQMPLRQAERAMPKELNVRTLTADNLTVNGHLEAAQKISTKNAFLGSITAQTLKAEEANINVLKLNGQTFDKDYVIAQACIENEDKSWWDVFKIGCLGTYIDTDKNQEHWIGQIVQVGASLYKGNFAMQFTTNADAKAKVRILGMSGWTSNALEEHILYLCCRVE